MTDFDDYHDIMTIRPHTPHQVMTWNLQLDRAAYDAFDENDPGDNDDIMTIRRHTPRQVMTWNLLPDSASQLSGRHLGKALDIRWGL